MMNKLFTSIPFTGCIMLSIVFLLTGIYQIITGKKSFLMRILMRKYNLPDRFTRVDGCMTTIAGCILMGTCFGYWYFSKAEILYTGYLLLCIFAFCEPFVIQKYRMDIEGTGKKYIIKNSIFVLLAIGIVLYFRPMTISAIFNDATVIKVSYSNLGIADGETYIDNTGYYSLTENEKMLMLSILSSYTYTRKLSSIFINGLSNGTGNEIILLYMENIKKESHIICISSLNEIIIDNHVYTAKNSRKIIEELKGIINISCKLNQFLFFNCQHKYINYMPV